MICITKDVFNEMKEFALDDFTNKFEDRGYSMCINDWIIYGRLCPYNIKLRPFVSTTIIVVLLLVIVIYTEIRYNKNRLDKLNKED